MKAPSRSFQANASAVIRRQYKRIYKSSHFHLTPYKVIAPFLSCRNIAQRNIYTPPIYIKATTLLFPHDTELTTNQDTAMPPHSRQLVYDLGHTSDSSESSRTNMISVHPKGWASTNRALKVAFRRTVRVSDNNALNDLPPDMGSFPLYEVSCYEDTLPSTMTKKGGYFLPMHRKYHTRPV